MSNLSIRARSHQVRDDEVHAEQRDLLGQLKLEVFANHVAVKDRKCYWNKPNSTYAGFCMLMEKAT